jgi:hypothetical protein
LLEVLSHTSPGPPPGAGVVFFAVEELDFEDDDELVEVELLDDEVDVLDDVGVEDDAGVAVLELLEELVVVLLLGVDEVEEDLLVELEVEALVAPHHVLTPLWPTQAPILVDALE